VLLMNSINMMDGVDGLAGGFCAIVAVFFMIAIGAGGGDLFQALLVLFACMAGFLMLNLRFPWQKSARVFLGDSGALCLGLLLGWFAIKTSQGGGAVLEPVSVIWIIALPVMDAFALFIARSLRGLPPFNPDRRHFHHRLLDMGLSPSITTLLILFVVVLMSLIGFSAEFLNVPAYILFYLWMVVFVFHTIAIVHPKGYLHFARLFRQRMQTNKTL